MTRAVATHRASGRPLLDLTETNPTAVGLDCPVDVLTALADPGGARYRPHPRGLEEARAAIARACVRSESVIDPSRVVLTASTSEAYAQLFKLLCDPSDSVLVPRPSYPLFDFLTRLECVEARPYRLACHGGRWELDRASVEATLSDTTRAVLVVSPNNPTGSMLATGDRDWLAGLCAARGLALIADEVFASYPLSPADNRCSLMGESRVLTFTLDGLSKSAGLPHLKLGWIIVSGPAAAVESALERLDIISDTYLSVATPVQVAAPRLIHAGRGRRDQILDRVIRNLDCLRRAMARCPSATLLEPEAGWSAVLRVPAVMSEEQWVLRLLAEHDVLVHPGYFFDFDHEAFVVISLLPEPLVFAPAAERLATFVSESAA